MRSFFDLVPCQDRALFLAKNLRMKLIQSLEHLFEVNKNTLGVLYHEAKEFLYSVDHEQRIPWVFYAANSLLLQATCNNTTGSIIPHLKWLFESAHKDGSVFSYFKNTDPKEKNNILKRYILFDLPPGADLFEPDQKEAQLTSELVTQALQLIKQTNKEWHGEISEFVTEFMIFDSDAIKAGSSFDLFGLIYINAANAQRSVINMVDTIIHEAAHFYLYSLCTEDPLVLNAYEEKFFSPIKGRDRPMIGVYHAAFVLTRVLMFLNVLKKNSCSTAMEVEIDELLKKYQRIVSESLNILNNSAKLTELGAKIIQAIEPIVYSDTLCQA